MAKQLISCGSPTSDHLEQFKQYASVPDNTRDAMLMKVLKQAMIAVQEHSNVAMLPCTFKLTLHDVEAGEPIRLYEGGSEVSSVVDENGDAVEYTQEGDRIILGAAQAMVTVTYSNEVIVPRSETLMPVVWQLATAIYDGEDAKVQASILLTTHSYL